MSHHSLPTISVRMFRIEECDVSINGLMVALNVRTMALIDWVESDNNMIKRKEGIISVSQQDNLVFLVTSNHQRMTGQFH